MKFPRFILRQDWFLETEIFGVKNKNLIFTKGQIFESNEKGEYHITHGGWTEETPHIGGKIVLSVEDMRKAKDGDVNLFSEEVPPSEEVVMTVEEIPEEEEYTIKNWRIQLDVKTTRSKLREVEKIINEMVKPIL